MKTRSGAQFVSFAAALAAGGLARPLPADIINVPGDQPTIQAGINAAMDGDEVVIAEGTYPECISFGGRAIVVRSTDPDDPAVVAATVITGCAGPPSAAVGFEGDEGPDSILRGVTVSNLNAVAIGWAIYVDSDATAPTIDRCVISENGTTGDSGAVRVNAGAPTITHCTITDNVGFALQSHGVGIRIGPDPGSSTVIDADATISECMFVNNDGGTTFAGAGIYIDTTGAVSISDCTFANNEAGTEGGGLRSTQESTGLAVANCTFDGNTAEFGGGAYVHAGTLSGCEFINNESFEITGPQWNGGGVVLLNGTLENCTFTNNHSTTTGGGLQMNNGTVTGCTFTGNSAVDGGGIHALGGTITNCTIEGNTADNTGGGMVSLAGLPTISECFVTMNEAGGAGGGWYVASNAAPTVVDSVFCQNTRDNLVADGVVTMNGEVIVTDNENCAPLSAFGACCLTSGDCIVATEPGCVSAAGVFQGAGVVCDDADCPPDPCPSDVNGDDVVGVADFLQLLGEWGDCP